MKFLITGINRGVGKALCEVALEQGHEVIGVSRKKPGADQLTFLSHPQFKLLNADVSRPEDLKTFTQELNTLSPQIDILINNAGVLLDQQTTFEELTSEVLMKTFEVNVIGVHCMTQIVFPYLQKAKQPKVISISSVMGSVADNSSGRYYAYRSSKAALNAWNKSFAIDHPKMAAVVMHPGWVQTEMGGAGATLSPRKSAEGIIKFAMDASLENSGRFYDYLGKELPW